MYNNKTCNLSVSELVYLITKYKQNELNHDESTLLMRWVECSPGNKELLERILQEESDEAIEFMLSIDVDMRYAELSNSIKTKRKMRGQWRKLSVAACFLLALTLISVYYLKRDALKEPVQLSANIVEESYFQTDNEVLFIDGENQQVFKVPATKESLSVNQLTNGELIKDKDIHTSIGSHQISRIITPKGKKVKFYLNDGTLVHLNADSEISFKINMEDHDRREVWLDGEAYFEVIHNNNSFIVHSGEETVEVFGTTFNVDSFKDNPYMQVSLLEGSVSVSVTNIGLNKVLRPGHQFTYNDLKKNYEIENVPTAKMALWLRDQVSFEQKSIQEITKKLSRWYNVDFVFDKNPPQSLFTAELSLIESLPELLDKLEMTKKVKFERLGGNKIAVRQL